MYFYSFTALNAKKTWNSWFRNSLFGSDKKGQLLYYIRLGIISMFLNFFENNIYMYIKINCRSTNKYQKDYQWLEHYKQWCTNGKKQWCTV